MNLEEQLIRKARTRPIKWNKPSAAKRHVIAKKASAASHVVHEPWVFTPIPALVAAQKFLAKLRGEA